MNCLTKRKSIAIVGISSSMILVATAIFLCIYKDISIEIAYKKMEFVRIPAGSFLMGSDSGSSDDEEKPTHKVTISKPFEIQTTEITQAQWQSVMGTTIRQHCDKVKHDGVVRGEGDNYPMYYVSWDDCQAFIRKLNEKDRGKNYRLPTEAEWEYACRAGTTGDCYGNINDIAWYLKNSHSLIYPVGQKQPNAWGLYDMLGNECEWCSDWYGKFSKGSEIDPKGPSTGSGRVIRGGSFVYDTVRASIRQGEDQHKRFRNVGFRLVRDAVPQKVPDTHY